MRDTLEELQLIDNINPKIFGENIQCVVINPNIDFQEKESDLQKTNKGARE